MGDVRTEYGFERTACACSDCQTPCRHMPGMLVPDDIERMSIAAGQTNPLTFAKENLAASQGALIGVRTPSGVEQIRVPTLVPRAKEGGACIFHENGKCTIHAAAPYGCAFFDFHMDKDTGDDRSMAGIKRIAMDWEENGPYSTVWRILEAAGHTARPPAESRQAIRDEIV